MTLMAVLKCMSSASMSSCKPAHGECRRRMRVLPLRYIYNHLCSVDSSDFLAQVRIEVNFAIKKKSLFTFTKEMADSMKQRLLIASYEEYCMEQRLLIAKYCMEQRLLIASYEEDPEETIKANKYCAVHGAPGNRSKRQIIERYCTCKLMSDVERVQSMYDLSSNMPKKKPSFPDPKEKAFVSMPYVFMKESTYDAVRAAMAGDPEWSLWVAKKASGVQKSENGDVLDRPLSGGPGMQMCWAGLYLVWKCCAA
jgi:hypothetical protein